MFKNAAKSLIQYDALQYTLIFGDKKNSSFKGGKF